MISPDLFQRLRAAQNRAAHEQQVLSGRDWLLVAFVVQVLALVSPLFAWINYTLLGAGIHTGLHPGFEFGAMFSLAVVLAVLWFWARHAPFRAAVTATIAFVAVYAALAYVDPSLLSVGAVPKSLVLIGLLQAARIAYFRHRAL